MANIGESDGSSIRVTKGGINYQIQKEAINIVYLTNDSSPSYCRRNILDYGSIEFLPAKYDAFNTTTLSSTFSYCRKVKYINLFNTSNVTDFSSTFKYTESLEKIEGDLDICNANSIEYMFSNSGITEIRFTSSDTKFTKCDYAFEKCSRLKEIPALNYLFVTRVYQTFASMPNLEVIHGELDFSNANNISYCFTSCKKLKSIPKITISLVKSVYTSGLFSGCSSLTSIPYINTSKIASFMDMFLNCTSLTNLGWDIDMSSATTIYRMIEGCPAHFRLKNVPSSLDLSKIGGTNYTVLNYI